PLFQDRLWPDRRRVAGSGPGVNAEEDKLAASQNLCLATRSSAREYTKNERVRQGTGDAA
ncbi:MAG: hypothetical protein AB7O31_13900, partial [Burkholderiales bacterium]